MARPVRLLVKSPPLLTITTSLLKRPEPAGAKLMTKLVQPEGAKLKGLPDSIAKGPGVTVACPSSAAEPELLSTRVACAAAPVSIKPKSRLVGVTRSWTGLVTTRQLVRIRLLVTPALLAVRLTV